MLRLLRFRSGYAAELPKFSTLNFAAAVFDCCFIAQTHYFFTAILPKFSHKIFHTHTRIDKAVFCGYTIVRSCF